MTRLGFEPGPPKSLVRCLTTQLIGADDQAVLSQVNAKMCYQCKFDWIYGELSPNFNKFMYLKAFRKMANYGVQI